MNDRLDYIRGLLASVTPGRWWWRDQGNGVRLGSDDDVVVGTITRHVGVSDEEVVDVEPFGEADAEILAAAPELLAWCVAEIDRLRGTALREPRCQCQWEAGDSPCRVHGEDDGGRDG